MGTRQVLYVDSIIAASKQLIEDFASEMDSEDPKSTDAIWTFAVHMANMLDRMGVPIEGIRLALGAYMDGIDDQSGDPLPCWLCDNPAVGLVQYGDGYRLACHRHAAIIAAEGHKLEVQR